MERRSEKRDEGSEELRRGKEGRYKKEERRRKRRGVREERRGKKRADRRERSGGERGERLLFSIRTLMK